MLTSGKEASFVGGVRERRGTGVLTERGREIILKRGARQQGCYQRGREANYQGR